MVSEKQRQYLRKYAKRPGVRERRNAYQRAYIKRSYVKKRINAYQRAYSKRPYAKEKRRLWGKSQEPKSHRFLCGISCNDNRRWHGIQGCKKIRSGI